MRQPRSSPNARRHRAALNPADRVFRIRLREPVRFPDLTERRALKLSAIPHYTARAHFGLWHRRMGTPNFAERSDVFTPLFYVEFETADAPLDTNAVLEVRGETSLGRTLDGAGAIDHLVREGLHTLLRRDGHGAGQVVARARLINVFTRYDPDPVRRRVTELPAYMGIGTVPSRVVDLPAFDTLLPVDRVPDCAETETHVWHYGQTDPNRHVSGMEYLHAMESYAAEALQRRGHDARHWYFSRARVLYRKPCFRGEGYRRVVWFLSAAPLVIAGAIVKAGDPPGSRPAVAIELTVSPHGDDSPAPQD